MLGNVFAIGLVAVFFAQIYYYLRYFFVIFWAQRKQKKGKLDFQTEKPPVSVVICSKNESENLHKFLPSILEQDYPNFEVVVVNDGSTDTTSEVLSIFKEKYNNLYETYIPQSAEIISRKKLGLTLGVKAAKNEILLFTDADCKAVSRHWISKVVRNFTPETEFVLGCGLYMYEKTFINRLISYDTLTIALQYLGFAFAGRPYMGVGRNLAYRKSTFMSHKGFAGLLHVQSGDDDLFVNHWATKQNTRVELSAQSITASLPKKSFREWLSQKDRHLSTSSMYKKTDLWRLGGELGTRTLFYLFFVLSLFFWTPMAGAIALSLFCLRLIFQIVLLNLSARKLGQTERFFHIDVVLFDIFLPLVNLFLKTRNKLFRRKNQLYKWK
ncbi:MAG: glycosyltransferase [Paludibacteraceae bacterium]|nr:glycosyltransferase [Paludibacteraceae bacterium]